MGRILNNFHNTLLESLPQPFNADFFKGSKGQQIKSAFVKLMVVVTRVQNIVVGVLKQIQRSMPLLTMLGHGIEVSNLAHFCIEIMQRQLKKQLHWIKTLYMCVPEHERPNLPQLPEENAS